jgi:hypothetical protein
VSAAAAVLAVALLSFLAAQACRESRASCAVCGRAECRALAFRVEYEDGASQETCCARCASHAVAQEKDRAVARLEARDFATGKRVDARSAVYVEGSDVEHCSAPKAERGSQGCCMEMAYDRCLPSLIAFERREAASAFIEEHGGRLKSFADLRFGARTKPGERR